MRPWSSRLGNIALQLCFRVAVAPRPGTVLATCAETWSRWFFRSLWAPLSDTPPPSPFPRHLLFCHCAEVPSSPPCLRGQYPLVACILCGGGLKNRNNVRFGSVSGKLPVTSCSYDELLNIPSQVKEANLHDSLKLGPTTHNNVLWRHMTSAPL